ncbi:MAG: hypothetical protein B6D58_01820 [candidate division Zixibacteria bacterium 4484_95]|nr:MAG: hypothetical protein B6D58_01820 [candidate division Zixibacteria bacterium 4484_95]
MAIKQNKAVFLDRDGVIITEKDFIVDIDLLEYIPRSVEALKLIPSCYLKIIISNQSGIGRGYFNAAQVEAFNEALIADLKKRGVSIDGIYYCPHKKEDNCNCRKPKTGLFEIARNRFGLDFSKCWVVGDKSSDIQAGINIGAKTVLVMTGYAGKEPSAENIVADFTVKDLYEAVEIIKS